MSYFKKKHPKLNVLMYGQLGDYFNVDVNILHIKKTYLLQKQ